MLAALATPGAHALAVVDDEAPEPEVKHRTAHLEFTDSVRAAKEAIVDGEVFQVVLSQRMDLDCPADPLDVYRVLRTVNPSPYMYLVHLGDGAGNEYHVVGSSPETLVKVAGREVTSYPIAGSRPRGETSAHDKELAEELLVDPKERAEHLMLVDLARNDLGRVCVPGTVAVVEFMEIKRFSHIMHMSSTVTGELRTESSALDVFRATFPAGTLSGAPKPRAIALIDELEPTRRGVYGGVVGYFDLAGDMDTAIAIRTAVIADGRATVQAGAGLVADSGSRDRVHRDPQQGSSSGQGDQARRHARACRSHEQGTARPRSRGRSRGAARARAVRSDAADMGDRGRVDDGRRASRSPSEGPTPRRRRRAPRWSFSWPAWSSRCPGG